MSLRGIFANNANPVLAAANIENSAASAFLKAASERFPVLGGTGIPLSTPSADHFPKNVI